MNILFYLLIYLYGVGMGGSSIALFTSGTLPFWALIINCIGPITLFLTPKSKIFFYVGLLLIIITSIINGFLLNGFPNPIHLLIRLLFSLLMIFLYKYINN